MANILNYNFAVQIFLLLRFSITLKINYIHCPFVFSENQIKLFPGICDNKLHHNLSEVKFDHWHNL